MALQSQFLSSFTTNTNTNVGRSVLWLCPTQPSLTIRYQKASSESSKSSKSNLEDPTPLSPSAPPKKPGVGFGSSNSNAAAAAAEASSASTSSSKKKQQKKGRRERASIIRRTPLEKPPFVSEQEKGIIAKEQTKNESAFLLAWLGFGAIILVEGIALAASGLLPEEWDKFFVKYLYPSFTPTVFLFVAGAVAFGVYKYMQNEKITKQK